MILTSTAVVPQISLESEKVFADVRTDVRTGGRTSEPHIEIIRSTLRSRPNKTNTNPNPTTG